MITDEMADTAAQAEWDQLNSELPRAEQMAWVDVPSETKDSWRRSARAGLQAVADAAPPTLKVVVTVVGSERGGATLSVNGGPSMVFEPGSDLVLTVGQPTVSDV